jgi:hypothetical protein
VRLRERLEAAGWSYSDGRKGPPRSGRALSECYPYTTIVGAEKLGYEDKRPAYKRKPKRMRAAEWCPLRTAACDELIRRVAGLVAADPPMDLASHPHTRALVVVDEPSPRSRLPTSCARISSMQPSAPGQPRCGTATASDAASSSAASSTTATAAATAEASRMRVAGTRASDYLDRSYVRTQGT